jgi:polysaccharide deacetylase
VSGRAVVLVYHAIEVGPPPLCIEPSLFRRHLDVIDESGIPVVGLDQLAAELAAGGPTGPTVAITFDDGAASVVEQAAPLLVERSFPAAIFCVVTAIGPRRRRGCRGCGSRAQPRWRSCPRTRSRSARTA